MRAALLASVICCATPASAFADAPWGADIEVMDASEMGELRGGLAVAPGLEVNFGAVITTYVNGTPALTTNLTWTDTGQFVEQTIGEVGQSLDSLTSEQRAELGLDGMENNGGIVIADADGVTALVHNVTEGALQNIIINTAAGRDLHQEVDVTLTLPGFETMQDALLLERIGIRLGADLDNVIIGAR